MKWLKNRFRKPEQWISEEERIQVIEKSSKRISRKLADELRKELKKLSKVRKAAAKKNTLEERAA